MALDYSAMSTEDLKAEIAREEGLVEDLKVRLAELEQRREEVRKDFERTVTLTAGERRIERRRRIGELEERIAVREEQIGELEGRIEAREAEVGRLRRRVAELEAEITPFTSPVSAFITRGVIRSVERSITALEGWQTRDRWTLTAFRGWETRDERRLRSLRGWQVREVSLEGRVADLKVELDRVTEDATITEVQIDSIEKEIEIKKEHLPKYIEYDYWRTYDYRTGPIYRHASFEARGTFTLPVDVDPTNLKIQGFVESLFDEVMGRLGVFVTGKWDVSPVFAGEEGEETKEFKEDVEIVTVKKETNKIYRETVSVREEDFEA